AANYALLKKDKKAKPLPSIPSTGIEVLLPQRTEKWPRTIFTIVKEVPLQTATPSTSPSPSPSASPKDDEAKEAEEPKVDAPLALVLVQERPRDNVKVPYAVTPPAGVVLPDVAAAATGTARAQPSVRVLKMAPEQLATSYGDTLINGEESEF